MNTNEFCIWLNGFLDGRDNAIYKRDIEKIKDKLSKATPVSLGYPVNPYFPITPPTPWIPPYITCSESDN